ncbi:hypothetical protein [Ruegeria arenilitoris]|uniref:hypothetical protein n=1 Tax=Ruegeria arenilitoris TaxID=1173585 RepID=UPI00147C8277|nr:hypothetical protein [Ruegeria arenilitoris]
MNQTLTRTFLLVASVGQANLLTTPAIANDGLAFSVPDEYRGCVETPYLFGENTFDEDGKIIAFPYYAALEKSPEVVLVPSTNNENSHQKRIRLSCSGFEEIRSNIDVVFEYDETFSFRVGYYAWVELLLLYSEAEAKNRRFGRSFYYVAAASETIRDGADACANFQSPNPSWDMFCTQIDLLHQVEMIQTFHDQLIATDYDDNEVNPDAVVEFDKIVASSLASAKAIAVGLPN